MRWDFARAALLGALVSLPVSLAIVAVPLSSTVDASATDMLALTNQFRHPIGSPTVPTDPRLQQAAPSPLPSGPARRYGSPIMLVYSAGQTVQFRAAELYGPNGARLPFYLAPQQFEYDYQVIVPQRPLATNTTYHVRFDITVAGTWLTNEWNFSTGSAISGGGPTATVPSDNRLHSAWASQTPTAAIQTASPTP